MANTLNINADLVRVADSRPEYSTTSYQLEAMDIRKSGEDYQLALAHFTVPDSILYKRITAIQLKGYINYSPVGSTDYVSLRFFPLRASFGGGVTYATMPEAITSANIRWMEFIASNYSGWASPASLSFGNNAKLILTNGVLVRVDSGNGGNGTISTSETVNQICVTVTYEDDEPLPTLSGSPSGGYVPKGKANLFRWYLSNPSTIVGTYSITSAVLKWRNAFDADYTSINVGAAYSYTMPAGTFADDTVYWYVDATLQDGRTVRSSTYTLSTQEPLGVATPESPINTVEDGSAPIRFAWSYANSSGMDPTASDLQVSTDGATWTDLSQVTGSSTEYTAPADSLPGGTVYWRVRSYNQDGAAGDWSPSVSFVNVAAPAAPIVSSDGAPFATITWQAVGQLAYELTVDGRSYGIAFGSGKSVTLPEPLADGEHTAAVRVQGAFGLWSQPGETAFSVTNSGGRTILLQGGFGEDAVLSWTEQEAGADVPASALSYTVYRDDARIAETEEQQYTDRLSLGRHTYRVIGRLSDGNAAYSNEVSGTVETAGLMIAEMDGGEWLRLRLSDQGMQEHGYNFSRTQSLRHIAGAAYPVLEQAPYYDQTGSFDVAFYSRDEARRFEALFGRVVVLKSPQGSVIIGPLSSMDKRENHFYTAYTFTIQRIHWEGADGQDD